MPRALLHCVGILASALLLAPTAGAQTEQPALAPVGDDPNAVRVLLTPEIETTLVSQMAGRIAKLQARLGAHVARGAVLMELDCNESQARLAMARAEHAAARQTLQAKEGLRRLDAAGDVEVALAAADVDKAKAAIALAQSQVAQCTVTAPFAGRVVKVHVKPYQGVGIGVSLVDLISEGPLKLRLNVPSRWLPQLREGLGFEVTINETGRSHPAHVTLINARIDAVAQTIELEARMDRDEPELLAGMSGIARFPIEP